MTRKPPIRPPVVTEERPIPEDLYPQFLSWESVAGEPIERVLACLRDLNEEELKEFFNSSSKDFCRLPAAALLCGQPEPYATLKDNQAILLRLPRPVRVDMVAGSAKRFRELVFQQLKDMGGAAGDTEKRKLLMFRRMHEHLIELSTAAFGDSKNSRAYDAIKNLRRASEELELVISKAQNEADPTVYFN